MARRRVSPETPTRYQDHVSEIRRYDRDQLLRLLAEASRGWDGSIYDAAGMVKHFLPWDILGAATVIICRGVRGRQQPTLEDAAWICHLFSNLEHATSDEGELGIRMVARFIYEPSRV